MDFDENSSQNFDCILRGRKENKLRKQGKLGLLHNS